MYQELGNVKEPVALTPQEALDSAVALLIQQGYRIVQRTEAVVTAERRKKSGMFRRDSLHLAVGVQQLPDGGVQIKLRGNDREGVRDRQSEWVSWANSLPKVNREQREHEGVARPEATETRTKESEKGADRQAESGLSVDDLREERVEGYPSESEMRTGSAGDIEEGHNPAARQGGWASVAAWDQEPRIAAGKHEAGVPPPPERPSGVGVNQDAADQERRDTRTGDEVFKGTGTESAELQERAMESNMEKHTISVGTDTVGETVSFTAKLLGTVAVNGGSEEGGMDMTFYRLPDHTYRVLVERGDISLLYRFGLLMA